jgi:hypothetical protein
MTPGYLEAVGLVARVPNDERAALNHQMRNALEGVAFLPFGRLMAPTSTSSTRRSAGRPGGRARFTRAPSTARRKRGSGCRR